MQNYGQENKRETKERVKWKVECFHWYLHQNHRVPEQLASVPVLDTMKDHTVRIPVIERKEQGFFTTESYEGKPLNFQGTASVN